MKEWLGGAWWVLSRGVLVLAFFEAGRVQTGSES